MAHCQSTDNALPNEAIMPLLDRQFSFDGHFSFFLCLNEGCSAEYLFPSQHFHWKVKSVLNYKTGMFIVQITNVCNAVPGSII